jgi:hypothetical protein
MKTSSTHPPVFNDILGTPPALARAMGEEIVRAAPSSALMAPGRRSKTAMFLLGVGVGAVLLLLNRERERKERWW